MNIFIFTDTDLFSDNSFIYCTKKDIETHGQQELFKTSLADEGPIVIHKKEFVDTPKDIIILETDDYELTTGAFRLAENKKIPLLIAKKNESFLLPKSQEYLIVFKGNSTKNYFDIIKIINSALEEKTIVPKGTHGYFTKNFSVEEITPAEELQKENLLVASLPLFQ